MSCFSSSTKQDANKIKTQGLYFTGLTSGFDRLGSLMATEHSLEVWACLRVLKNSNIWNSRFTKRKGRKRERFIERTTLICCFSESLCRPWITELQGLPHKHHNSMGLASCILLSYMNNLYFALKKPTTSWPVKKQTMPTYFDACFWFLLREQVILFGIRIKSLFKRHLPFPPCHSLLNISNS